MLGRFARRTALAGAVAYGVYSAGIRPWKHRWDASPDERRAILPGDDLVPTPTSVETRAITVGAPPSAVWPWLVQMGHGRAGWYSYDRLDRDGQRAWRLNPQFEDLTLGAMVPTHPHGGFKVVGLEHECVLVLYMDATLAQERASLPEFSVSWTFVLQPLPSSKTRLIERVRTSIPEGGVGHLAFQRVTGFGIFLMQRKQLLGIKARAERTWRAQVQEPVESHIA
ncbi:MAG TPA: SRPBCC family protein [bacterium]|nr:SRPBCC family protein [bacterium]